MLVALALAFGMYEYGTARSHGSVSSWLDMAVSLVFIIGVPAVILIRARHSEDIYVGNLSDGKVALDVGENVLFESRFMSGQLFPSGTAFKPDLGFGEWLKGGPIRVIGLLTVRLTNRRLIFGLLVGRTWRVIDLSDIREARLIRGRWPYNNALLVEYEFCNSLEKILFWTGSGRGNRLRIALEKEISSP